MIITYQDFERIDLCSGTIIKAETFPKARNPSYKVWMNINYIKSLLFVSHVK